MSHWNTTPSMAITRPGRCASPGVRWNCAESSLSRAIANGDARSLRSPGTEVRFRHESSSSSNAWPRAGSGRSHVRAHSPGADQDLEVGISELELGGAQVLGREAIEEGDRGQHAAVNLHADVLAREGLLQQALRGQRREPPIVT